METWGRMGITMLQGWLKVKLAFPGPLSIFAPLKPPSLLPCDHLITPTAHSMAPFLFLSPLPLFWQLLRSTACLACYFSLNSNKTVLKLQKQQQKNILEGFSSLVSAV